MRKYISTLVTALAVSALLLCGCSNKTESSASTPESSASTSESSASTPESSESTPESSTSTPESSLSSPESSESIPELSASTPESSESTPESTSSVTESSTPAETNPALQKYYEEMIANYFEYVSGTVPGNTPEIARGIAEAETAGLEKFGKMTVPNEYADRHSALMKAAETEREYIKLLLDYANGVIDNDEMTARALVIRPNNRSEFTTHCLNIVADLNHEPSVVPTEKGQMLEMLSKL